MKRIYRIVLFFSLLGFCHPVFGQSRGLGELRWTHYGLRPMAMGNAFVAVADDYNAIFYNPAGLARLKDWRVEVINPMFEVSANTIEFAQDINELVGGSGGETSDVLELLEKNTGKTHHFAFGLTPYFVTKNFGFGIGFDLNTTLAVHRQIATDVEFGPRITIPFSFAMTPFEGFNVGASVKMVAKGGVDRTFSINDIQAFTESDNTDSSSEDEASLDDYVEGGIGYGADIGILYTPIKTMEPTIGISITDFGGTPYSKLDVGGEALGAPETRLPSVNTGISLKPWSTDKMYLRTSVDAHAINQPIHYSKKFNAGAEWGYSSIIKVQTGLHQGEFAGGFEFDVFLLTMRFVTYAEQLGAIAGQDDNLSDRRYAFQLKLLL